MTNKEKLIVGKEYCLSDLVKQYSFIKTDIVVPSGLSVYRDDNFRYLLRKIENDTYRLEIKFK